MPDRPADLVETAVRAFTLRPPGPGPQDDDAEDTRRGRRGPWRSRWREALVWDTETVTTPDQSLLVLCWRLYVLEEGHPPRCLEEGFAYPDDLPQREPAGYEVLVDYVAAHPDADIEPGLGRMGGSATRRLEPLSWWLHQRLFLRGYKHRERCDIVGFNLLFDVGRLAAYWAPAEDDYYGGWSLGIWGSYGPDGKWHAAARHPRLRAKAIDPRRTLFEWGSIGEDPDYWKGRGRFVDLRTLAFALTDRGHTLESACHAFDVPFHKAKVKHGTITSRLLAYALKDVEATARLYFACLDELARHEGIDLEPHRLYSPATIGARYLDAMGYQRPLEKFTNLDHDQLGWTTLPEARRKQRQRKVATDPNTNAITPELLGWAMSAFYGGRAEARIVRTPVPVALVDFTSMYPSVNALLDTRSILNAAEIAIHDATDDVRELLKAPDLVHRLLDPAVWRRDIGVTLVEIQPEDDILPVRAKYDPTSGDYGIGVNPYHLDGSAWYALPDVLAATILAGGKHPRVIRAVRLVGQGTQPGLKAVTLRGDRELDPLRDDPFLAMIEERHRVLRDPALAVSERKRRERFLKITANSTSYGVLARFDRRERAAPTAVMVHGPGGRPFEAKTAAPEDPGPYCFPPVAASITAAARLMLALLEHQVTTAGGAYAFCDTDSLAIVATEAGGPIPCPTTDADHVTALSWSTLQGILDRFTPLNPYDPALLPGSPWGVKQQGLTRQVTCYAISAKRYVLYLEGEDAPHLLDVIDQADEDAAPDDVERADTDELADWSEHGLGLYLDPTATDPDESRRDSEGRRLWTREAWEWLLTDALTTQPPAPAWYDRYAVTRFTLSGPRTAAWFDGYNAPRPRQEWIRPGSFGLIAHPAPGFNRAEGGLPAAPYEPNPTRWSALAWYDRGSGRRLAVTTMPQRGAEDVHQAVSVATPVQTIGDVIRRYRLRPEHKSAAPDGTPARRDTVGALTRRPIESTLALQTLSGKEGNKLLERLTGEVTDPTDYRADYGARAETWGLVVAAIRHLGAASVARRSGLHRRTIERTLRQGGDASTPHRANQARIAAAAAAEARDRLHRLGETPPSGTLPTLLRYLQI
jgi:hypothetical protein